MSPGVGVDPRMRVTGRVSIGQSQVAWCVGGSARLRTVPHCPPGGVCVRLSFKQVPFQSRTLTASSVPRLPFLLGSGEKELSSYIVPTLKA